MPGRRHHGQATPRSARCRSPGPGVAPNTGPVPVQRPSDGSAISTDAPSRSSSALVFVGLVGAALRGTEHASSATRQHGRVRRRLSIYTLTGRPAVEAGAEQRPPSAAARSLGRRSSSPARSCSSRDFETALAQRLDAAACRCEPPSGCSSTSAPRSGLSVLLFLLFGGGSPLPAVLGLVVGTRPALDLPHRQGVPAYVGLPLAAARHAAAGRRQPVGRATRSPQAMDTVVREGQQPITGEFNRALVEARLGVPIEDAMDGIAERMKSKDFAWVVMAIRIQREVGGNLAELLTTVAATLRERERLRRQVSVALRRGPAVRLDPRPAAHRVRRVPRRWCGLSTSSRWLPTRSAGCCSASAFCCSWSARRGCARPSRWRSEMEADLILVLGLARSLPRARHRAGHRRRHHLGAPAGQSRSLAAVNAITDDAVAAWRRSSTSRSASG